MQKIEDFVNVHKIKIKVESISSNPFFVDGRDDMDHYRVILRIGRRQFTTYFSKGYGHSGKEPTTEEVLDCMASDASGYENARSFEDWCGEYGYDEDSRKAETIFNNVAKQSTKLKNFLGEKAYNNLLWDTERE